MAAKAAIERNSRARGPDGHEYAARLGELIRERRIALGLRQDDLVFTTGLARSFIIDLEAGKPGCHLGKALLVANAVGLRLLDVLQHSNADNALLPDVQELPDDIPDPHEETREPPR